jgi:hypothetical protein
MVESILYSQGLSENQSSFSVQEFEGILSNVLLLRPATVAMAAYSAHHIMMVSLEELYTLSIFKHQQHQSQDTNLVLATPTTVRTVVCTTTSLHPNAIT